MVNRAIEQGVCQGCGVTRGANKSICPVIDEPGVLHGR